MGGIKMADLLHHPGILITFKDCEILYCLSNSSMILLCKFSFKKFNFYSEFLVMTEGSPQGSMSLYFNFTDLSFS